MLIQFVIFWKRNPNLPFKKSGFNLNIIALDNPYLRDFEVLDERDYIIIRLQLDIKKDQGRVTSDGWLEVDSNDFRRVMKMGDHIVSKQILAINEVSKNLKLLGTYQMFITGSEKDFWTKSEIDIHKFKIDMNGVGKSLRLSDLESETNIAIFNRELLGTRRIRGDILNSLKLPTTLYGLGNIANSDENTQMPKIFLLNLTLENSSDIKNKDISVQNKQLSLAINTVISNFGKLLAHMGKLTDLYQDEYKSIQSKSNEIRDQALELQIKINNALLKKSGKSKGTSLDSWRKRDNKEEVVLYHGWEEKLLLKASRYFSLLTEINQVLARVNYQRHEAASNIEKSTSNLGLTPIKYVAETGKEITSLGLDLKQFSESINYYFQNLKLELDHSQSTIRNTVDILKTFLESEQRIVSQKVGELFNWIVIVFAGLGLADALGNFVIFVLEGGSIYDAMFWFFIILSVLFLIVVILYFWIFRRPKILKAIG
jgi:hypothetical protein